MNRRHLPTLATLAVVLAPAAAFADEPAAAPREGRTPGTPTVPDTSESQTPERFMAQVLATEPEQGRLIVATERGMLELFASPEEVAALKVGDTIEIVMRESDADRPPPRNRT